jgi:hypothetical protein
MSGINWKFYFGDAHVILNLDRVSKLYTLWHEGMIVISKDGYFVRQVAMLLMRHDITLVCMLRF